MPCLGTDGAPVLPKLAYGAFPGAPLHPVPQYGNASALIITLQLDNRDNSTFDAMAMAFEKEFLQVVSRWAAEHEDSARVAYSAQRSIGDELQRESRADVRTVAASYFAMFVYISISLGRYRQLGSGNRLKSVVQRNILPKADEQLPRQQVHCTACENHTRSRRCRHCNDRGRRRHRALLAV